MSERSHSTPIEQHPKRRRVRAVLAVSTAVVVLGSGVAYLLLQPGSASAESKAEPGPRRTAQKQFGGSDRAAQRAADGLPGKSKAPPKFVAVVNSDRISWLELAQECIERHGNEVLGDLINRRMIEQECKARGVRVTSAEVDAEVESVAERFRVPPEQWLETLQKERGIKPEQYAEDIIWPTLALRKLAQNRVEVTEEDLQKAFESNYGPRVRARMILTTNQRRAVEVWEKAKASPDDFGRLAREWSEDPASRPLDGQIKPIPRHSSQPTLEEEAFKLKEGEISGVIQLGDQRWVILKCEGRTEPRQVALEEVRQSLIENIRDAKMRVEMAKVFQEMKGRARIENYLTGTTTADRAAAGGAAVAAGRDASSGGASGDVPATASRPAGSRSIKR